MASKTEMAHADSVHGSEASSIQKARQLCYLRAVWLRGVQGFLEVLDLKVQGWSGLRICGSWLTIPA